MRRNERVHEGLKVGPPPLRQCIADYPLVVYAFACKLCADWCEALVQPRLESLNLVILSTEVVAGSEGRQ
jgi:hypothetical protein